MAERVEHAFAEEDAIGRHEVRDERGIGRRPRGPLVRRRSRYAGFLDRTVAWCAHRPDVSLIFTNKYRRQILNVNILIF